MRAGEGDDLSVVEHISDRVGVMYLGTMCELSETGLLFEKPRHPYTQGLLASIPRLSRRTDFLVGIKGSIPSFIDPPMGFRRHRWMLYQ